MTQPSVITTSEVARTLRPRPTRRPSARSVRQVARDADLVLVGSESTPCRDLRASVVERLADLLAAAVIRDVRERMTAEGTSVGVAR